MLEQAPDYRATGNLQPRESQTALTQRFPNTGYFLGDRAIPPLREVMEALARGTWDAYARPRRLTVVV